MVSEAKRINKEKVLTPKLVSNPVTIDPSAGMFAVNSTSRGSGSVCPLSRMSLPIEGAWKKL
jgi:hypothetical protein